MELAHESSEVGSYVEEVIEFHHARS